MSLTERERKLYGHQIERAEFRYGLKLTPADLHHIAKKIKNREGTFLHNLPDGRSGGRNLDGAREAWKVEHQGKTLVAVYRTTVKEIVTFLPAQQEFAENGRQIGNVKGR